MVVERLHVFGVGPVVRFHPEEKLGRAEGRLHGELHPLVPAAARLHGLIDERCVAIELSRLEPATKGPPQEAAEHLAGLLLLGHRRGTGQQPFLGCGPRVERPGEFQATDEHGGRSRVRGRLVEGDQHPLAASQRREADRDRIRRLARRARDDERFEDPRWPHHGAREPVELFLRRGLRQFLAA